MNGVAVSGSREVRPMAAEWPRIAHLRCAGAADAGHESLPRSGGPAIEGRPVREP